MSISLLPVLKYALGITFLGMAGLGVWRGVTATSFVWFILLLLASIPLISIFIYMLISGIKDQLKMK